MKLIEAQKIIEGVLQPCPYESFFENIVGQRPLALLNAKSDETRMLLGSDPKSIILAEFAKYSSLLTSHIHTPTVPPPVAKSVASAEAFYDLIKEYQQRGYTVRIPDALNLSPQLSAFTRALEVAVENPVGVVIFWSGGGATAPIHHDEVDVIAIQLVGTKKWFISDETPTLPNRWKAPGETLPSLGKYSAYEVKPGDLLYLPRGTAHTVQSSEESIHLSIGFVPVTIREAINAVLDHLADFDRPLRSGLGVRADDLASEQSLETILQQVRDGLEKMQRHCQTDLFIQEALMRRRSKMIVELPKLTPAPVQTEITINSKVRHNPLSITQLIVTDEIVDFIQPGEQTLIHLGAEQCLSFIMKTEEFKVADIPGEVGDDVRIAIVNKMLASGYLEPVVESISRVAAL